MHMTRLASPSPEPAGTPAARCCGCCSRHPEVEIGALTGGSNAGEPLGALQPHLVPLADRVARGDHAPRPWPATTSSSSRLPHGAVRPRSPQQLRRRTSWSSTAAPTSGSPTRPPGSSSTAATHAGTWPYGLPELPGQREQLAGATPDRRPRLLPDRLDAGPRARRRRRPGRRRDVVVVAATGTSGAGKAAKPHLLGSEVMGIASAYGVGGVHRHTPEIIQNLSALTDGRRSRVSFTPVLVPMPRGILATCSAPLRDRRLTADEAYAAYAEGVRRRAVRAPAARRASGRRPSRCIGSNTVHLQVTVDAAAGRLVAVGAVDNLTKGTAGAAVQCMNLALGLARDRPACPRRTRAMTAADDRLAARSEQFPEKLGRASALGPGCRGPALGASRRVAVLDHRAPHRTSCRWSARTRACRARCRAGRAVHRVRSRQGPLDFSLTGVLGRAAGAAGRGGDQRLHASRPSTPTGSWCRSTRPTTPPRRGDDQGTPSPPPSPSSRARPRSPSRDQ